MARRVNIVHVDDIDNKPITDTDAPSVSFALDGTHYEIDLHEQNQVKLRKALGPFITNARKVGTKTGRAGKRTTSSNAREVRDWARSNGFPDIPARGRIPRDAQEAWDNR
jgi:hypothetical protein